MFNVLQSGRDYDDFAAGKNKEKEKEQLAKELIRESLIAKERRLSSLASQDIGMTGEDFTSSQIGAQRGLSLATQQIVGNKPRTDDITVGGGAMDGNAEQEPGYGSFLGTCSSDAVQIFWLGQSSGQDIPNPSLLDIPSTHLNSDFPPLSRTTPRNIPNPTSLKSPQTKLNLLDNQNGPSLHFNNPVPEKTAGTKHSTCPAKTKMLGKNH